MSKKNLKILDNSRVEGNKIIFSSGDLDLLNLANADLHSCMKGGAIVLFDIQSVLIRDSVFLSNGGLANGGAICINGPSVQETVITGGTEFISNEGYFGGAINIFDNNKVTFTTGGATIVVGDIELADTPGSIGGVVGGIVGDNNGSDTDVRTGFTDDDGAGVSLSTALRQSQQNQRFNESELVIKRLSKIEGLT